jgi:hypothetical protein
MFRKFALSQNKLRLYFLKKLPMAFIAGLRVRELNDEKCTVSIPYKYVNQNPFRSMYFAAQSMAAELSTALLAMDKLMATRKKYSMLVVNMQASFSKKAAHRVFFTCADGNVVHQAVDKALKNAEGATFVAKTIGIDQEGNQVSEFQFTWSIKIK